MALQKRVNYSGLKIGDLLLCCLKTHAWLPPLLLSSVKQAKQDGQKNGQSDSQHFKICEISMKIGCILLRKLDSGQYFDQFLRLTDILYKWQCLLPQNPSQYLQRYRKQVN